MPLGAVLKSGARARAGPSVCAAAIGRCRAFLTHALRLFLLATLIVFSKRPKTPTGDSTRLGSPGHQAWIAGVLFYRYTAFQSSSFVAFFCHRLIYIAPTTGNSTTLRPEV